MLIWKLIFKLVKVHIKRIFGFLYQSLWAPGTANRLNSSIDDYHLSTLSLQHRRAYLPQLLPQTRHTTEVRPVQICLLLWPDLPARRLGRTQAGMCSHQSLRQKTKRERPVSGGKRKYVIWCLITFLKRSSEQKSLIPLKAARKCTDDFLDCLKNASEYSADSSCCFPFPTQFNTRYNATPLRSSHNRYHRLFAISENSTFIDDTL